MGDKPTSVPRAAKRRIVPGNIMKENRFGRFVATAESVYGRDLACSKSRSQTAV